jgi:hypothetical protein
VNYTIYYTEQVTRSIGRRQTQEKQLGKKGEKEKKGGLGDAVSPPYPWNQYLCFLYIQQQYREKGITKFVGSFHSLFSKRTTPYSCVDMSEFSSKYIQTARKGCITLLFLREKGQQQLIRMNSVHPLLYWCCCLLASPNPPGFCFQNWNVKIKSIERIDDLSSASTSIDSFFFLSQNPSTHILAVKKRERDSRKESMCW